MPKSTLCKLENSVIGIEAALLMRDQSKYKRKALPNFKCIDCNSDVNPHHGSNYGLAHFEHVHRNVDCPLSDHKRCFYQRGKNL